MQIFSILGRDSAAHGYRLPFSSLETNSKPASDGNGEAGRDQDVCVGGQAAVGQCLVPVARKFRGGDGDGPARNRRVVQGPIPLAA